MGSLAKRVVDDVIGEMAEFGVEFDDHFRHDAELRKLKPEALVSIEMVVDDLLDPVRVQVQELVAYCLEHGGTLRSHRNFSIMVNELTRMLEK
jgi:hypothetical protein